MSLLKQVWLIITLPDRMKIYVVMPLIGQTHQSRPTYFSSMLAICFARLPEVILL